MQLFGRDLSPFTRRVGISLKLLDIPFEWRQLAVVADRDRIQAVNPMTRVPALVVQEDEPALVESSQILAYIDSLVEPERRLTPASGAAQRLVLRLVGMGTGAMEKGVSSFYERTRRPKEFTYQSWVEQCDSQVLDALGALEEAAASAKPWLAGERLTQADVTAVVALDFIDFTAPYLGVKDRFPGLAALAARAYALPPFAETSLEKYR
ncbi:MAG TPA: glutathione S-transferase family protein [Kiloniellales bacterium]|nr:glutathione S-transferase family protein [Kiloniellales bacterium]